MPPRPRMCCSNEGIGGHDDEQGSGFLFGTEPVMRRLGRLFGKSASE